MGDAVVSALVKEVLRRLTSELIKEFGLHWGFKNNILMLQEDLTKIQAVLEDAEEKHSKAKAVELWLKSLRSASLELENVFDEISTQALLQRLHKKRGIKYKVRAFFSSNHNQLMFRVRAAHKVQSIRRKLDAIASKRFELKLTSLGAISNVDDIGVACEMPDRETSSLIHDSSIIFGRNKEIEMVTSKICNKDIGKHSDGQTRVYGIWGMGGVGKTTLAQLVFNHERVNQYFDLKCWIYVSENFQVKDIIKGIIMSIDKCECLLTCLELLQESLQNKLRGKKYLIILDDVWIEYGEKAKWDRLSEILSCGAEGSIVLTTTRSQTTSRLMSKVPELQHKLGCLSKEDSWLLFEKLAFAQGREGDDINELKPIGREIADKCEGLPLAVKTLGSLMWSKHSIHDWQRVKGNNVWELPENNILLALKLSYDNLAPHLKRCFAYCCLFPKGYEMEKEELIFLWMSNGFIPPRGEIELYFLGEEIFNCLVWRSFIFKVKKLSKDRYIMHDIMHDMAQHVMRDEGFVIKVGKEVVIPNKVLHWSSSSPDEKSFEGLEKLSSLRSIFMIGEKYKCDVGKIFNHMNLKVLYLVGIELRTLPESICKLKHLKYMNLSESCLEVLPKSIIYLQNLQVLRLHHCIKLRKLPKGLRYMTNLQCLNINACASLIHLPIGIKELTSLRILSLFPVGTNNAAKIGELGYLNLLEGELKMSRLENVKGFSEAKSANLKCKTNLSALNLAWSSGNEIRESRQKMYAHDEEVLEGLEPNPCLKELKISFYMGNIISPSWMTNLRNLVEIIIFCCDNCEHIPTLGRLPNLRSISLLYMDSFKSFHDKDENMLGDSSNMFLCLQDLYISCCPNLVSLPSNFPKLKILNLVECNKLLSLPDEIRSFKDLNELEIRRCKHLTKRCEKDIGVDWTKISHIPNIHIYPSRPYQDEDDVTVIKEEDNIIMIDK